MQSLFIEQRKLLDYFFDQLDLQKAEEILQKLYTCRGALFFTGIGKSGMIARKLAVSFTSMGTRAFFLSPLDALHGDLGGVRQEDFVILLSKSGETKELMLLLPHLQGRVSAIIGFVSDCRSTLFNACDLAIALPVLKELCPFNLAPTTSTAVQLIFGDILAVALMQKKRVSLQEYAYAHPSGTIGKKSSTLVADLMKKGEAIPICHIDDTLEKVLPILSEKRCGAVLVVDADQNLAGIFTDGDLRRFLEKRPSDLFTTPLKQLMISNPKTIGPEATASEALSLMEENPTRPILVLPVVLEKRPMGILHMHDIIQAMTYSAH